MTKTYNIVTNQKIIGIIKKSKYFRVNLGMSVTMEKNGDRVISDKDHFAVSYNFQYKTTIYAQGNVGNMKFYTDYFIREDKIAAYFELEEFLFDYDESFVINKGIDAYLGHLLKEVDTQYHDLMNKNKIEKEESIEKPADPNKLVSNPGGVTYDDIKKYMQEKRMKN
jgi:hypothetical protein